MVSGLATSKAGVSEVCPPPAFVERFQVPAGPWCGTAVQNELVGSDAKHLRGGGIGQPLEVRGVCTLLACGNQTAWTCVLVLCRIVLHYKERLQIGGNIAVLKM